MLDQSHGAPTIRGHYIGGDWVPASRLFDDTNPSDGSVWARIPDGGASEARQAIDAAQKAFSGWKALHFQERARYMLKCADIVEKRADDYVAAAQFEGGGWYGKGCLRDQGNPRDLPRGGGHLLRAYRRRSALASGQGLPCGARPDGRYQRHLALECPRYSGDAPIQLHHGGGQLHRPETFRRDALFRRLFFAEVMEEAGVPPGVFNVITSSRERVAEMGDEMIDNPLVKGVAFTGSTAVGRRIAAKCGAHLKKCCIELGGKDSLIIREDADMERATSAASFGAFMHQGQICMSVEKVLVHKNIYQDFLSGFIARAAKLKTGNVADRNNVIGPLINDKQAANVKHQLDDAQARGAKIALGGGVNGRFVEPTIVTDVTPDMDIWRYETFGPVAVVAPFRTDREAIEMNNDTEYGLSSGIITADEERALAMAQHMENGMCHVNCSPINDEAHAPFGGTKASGIGRYGGRWSFESFSETRWITLERGGKPFPPVF